MRRRSAMRARTRSGISRRPARRDAPIVPDFARDRCIVPQSRCARPRPCLPDFDGPCAAGPFRAIARRWAGDGGARESRRQGYAVGALGTGRRAVRRRVCMSFRTRGQACRASLSTAIDRAAKTPGTARRQTCRRHRHHRRIRRGASRDRQADRLHLDRFRRADSPRMRSVSASSAFTILCAIARKLVDPLGVGRVIARPFIGTSRATFRRTPNRKDFPIPAPAAICWIARRGGSRDRHARQDRRHLWPSRDGARDQGPRQRCDRRRAARDAGHARGRRARLRQSRRFRYGFRTSPRCRRLCGGARSLRPPIAAHSRAAAAGRSSRHHRRPRQRSDRAAAPTTRARTCRSCASGAGLAGRTQPLRETFADVGQSIAAHLRLAPVARGASFL